MGPPTTPSRPQPPSAPPKRRTPRLLATRQRTLIVEGHTNSRGSESHNIDLSLCRAEAVRDFLIQKGYDRARISAQGIGRSRPIADNNSAEGCANNRRVEIVKKQLDAEAREPRCETSC